MKRILFLITFLFCLKSNAQNEFITKWDLSQIGSNSTSISFDVGTTGMVNYSWETVPTGIIGSGFFSGTNATITGLPINSIIRLKINPTNFNQFKIQYGIDKERLIDVEQWGITPWINMNSSFAGCSNLNITANDIPNLALVSDMSHMFQNCTILNSPNNINNWNTTNVTDMNGMFSSSNFNQPISNWDVSNVTNMSNMFSGNFWGFDTASNPFNQPIGNWDVSNVIDMSYMFCFNSNFNQPINNWDVSNVTNMSFMFASSPDIIAGQGGTCSFNQPLSNWNTINVIDMSYMFASNHSFNQPLSNWNTMNVINMELMFIFATQFNQSIGTWHLNPNVMLSNMLNWCGLDCINYSEIINNWANNINTPNGRNLGAYGINYGTNAISGRNNLINTKGWTISYDLFSSGNCCIITNSTQNITACNSIFFNNQTLTTSGIYYDTLQNVNGCDSLIELHLTINHSSSSTQYATACNSYFFNNQSFTTSGIYYDTLQSANGCDSLVELQLTINHSLSSTQNITACNSYFFNNQTLTNSGIYHDTLQNAFGCDSLIELHLTINHSSSSTQNITACNSYFFNNQTLTNSGIYHDTLQNVNGCDSLVELHLTINSISNNNIIQHNDTLVSTSLNVNYQWITCNPFQLIQNATYQNYIVTANGDYAVIVSQNGCVDTSTCFSFYNLEVDGIENNENVFQVYPNPAYSILFIKNAELFEKYLYNSIGQLILNTKANEIDVSRMPIGLYYLKVGNQTKKIIVEK